MKIVGIISEYNLYHSGHEHQIRNIRETFPDVGVVAIMSGNYVQRGSLAILPKYERALAASMCGVDLVLELTYPYSGSSAEYFARGAISIINSLNIVDYLCFGSESNDIDYLKTIAQRLLSVEFKKNIEEAQKEYKSTSKSFPKMQQEVYESLYNENFISTSNDILGIEYLKALILSESNVQPYSIKRIGTSYNDENFDTNIDGIISATAIRKLIFDNHFENIKNYVPENAYSVYENNFYNNQMPVDIKNIESAILSFFRLSYKAKNSIEARLCKCADNATSIDEFLTLCSTKKYTNSKIRRLIFESMIGVTEEHLKAKPLYTSVLSANSKGIDILKKLKSCSDITILTKTAHYKRYNADIISQFNLSAKAEKLYTLAIPKKEKANINIFKKPYIIA